MPKTPLAVQEFDQPRPAQKISEFDISGEEMLAILNQYDVYGIWMIDLESSRVYWSRDIYELHGMDYTPGHVDLKAAIDCYHPEDAKIVGQLIDESIANKSGFRFQLRLKQADNRYKMVTSSGRYRVSPDGKEQVIGLFSALPLPIRSVASTFLSEECAENDQYDQIRVG